MTNRDLPVAFRNYLMMDWLGKTAKIKMKSLIGFHLCCNKAQAM
jgi:hypothetical protein